MRKLKRFLRHIRHPRDWWHFHRIYRWWDGYDTGHKVGVDEGIKIGYNAALKSQNGRVRVVNEALDTDEVKEPGGL